MKRSPLESIDADIGDEPVPLGWLLITMIGVMVGVFWWGVIGLWWAP